MQNGKIRFSADDRNAIRKQTVGKPTEVTIELGGIEFALVPLTVEQSDEVFALLDAFSEVQKQANASGDVAAAGEVWASLVSTEGRRTKKLLRDVLLSSAEAAGIVDDIAVFDEWLGRLPLIDTVKALLPKLLEAQGLLTMLGNSSPPAQTPT